MKLMLYRHAQTAGNIARRYVGRTDESLCALGIETAKSIPPNHSISKVYVSPLRRTRETAGILFPEARQVVCPGLAEMDFGDYEGYTHDELMATEPYRLWVDSGCELPCPGGESKAEFTRRVTKEFESLVSLAIDAGEESLCLVVHGGTIMAICSEYATPHRPYFSWHVGNCGGVVGELDPASWKATRKFTVAIEETP